MQCISLYKLTSMKTHDISKQTINSCCSIFTFQRYISRYILKDTAMLLVAYTPIMKESGLLLVSLVSETVNQSLQYFARTAVHF